MRTWTLALLLAAPMLAGCLNGSDSPDGDDQTNPNADIEPADMVDGRFLVDVPVPVILVGFPDTVQLELQTKLTSLRPDAIVYNNARLVSEEVDQPDPDNVFAGSSPRPNPMDPTAIFSYHTLNGAKDRILAEWESLVVDDDLLDANAVDDILLEEIQAAGIPIDANHPGFVLVHLGSNDHAYRMQYPTGYVDGTRAFGERHPFTVLDLSARVDSYVGQSRPYNAPPEAGDLATVAQAAIENATWFRTLQGPIYPQATKECHAVTLIVVTRSTTISQSALSYTSAEELLDTEFLTDAWEQMLGEGRVNVDSRIIVLPADDPALEAVLRESNNEALRAYMNENWDDYHFDHEGCEEYMSVFLIGDAADSGISGIAMYDSRDGRRLSMSWMNDLNMVQGEDGELGFLYNDDPSRDGNNWVNFLFSHETGHLFGQRHPHDISSNGGPSAGQTFGATWSAMSYQQDGKMPLFGAVDINNYWRNRAGFMGEEAVVLGLETSPEFEQYLRLLAQHEWQEAGDVLMPLVN